MTKNDLSKCLHLEDIKPGDVLLFTPNPLPKGWVGQAIIWLTGGTVSHSAIFLGSIDGENKVAHAIPEGITIASFQSLLESEPLCYVKRFNSTIVIKPVLDQAIQYASGGNPYPLSNLGILGLLLLVNRFSEKTLTNLMFYEFALLVGVKIMKELQERIHPDTTPMTCSQFATQCYTDGGEDDDIQFKKLFIQFGSLGAEEGSHSLFELSKLHPVNGVNNIEIPNQEAILKNEQQIVENFQKLVLHKHKDASCESANELNPVSKEKLAAIGHLLLQGVSLNKFDNLDFSTTYVSKKNSTNRNYYVTPDDLFSNASNLDLIGFIDKRVL